ncbi:MAG: 50S ribosomal protein L35 [Oscillospiraceae bacterium]|nr:50S ribosomal protein L35 [Oscillospiraceae bacterium]
MAAAKVKKVKVKTHSGAKKRFQVTGTGKVKFQHAYKRHRLNAKDTKVKRVARNAGVAAPANAATIREMVPYK